MRKLQKKSLDGEIIFLLMLFGAFALSALAVVSLGAKAFERIESNMEGNYAGKTAAAYVIEKIRQHDQEGMVEFIQMDEKDVILLKSELEGTMYHTYIYEDEQYLKELFVKAGKEPSLSYGEKLIPLKSFSIQKEKKLYRLSIEDEEGKLTSCYLHPRTERAGN